MSGLLAHGLSYGNELRKRLRSLLTDPIPYTQEALNTALPPVEELAAQGRQMQATGKVPAEIDPRIMDLGMGLLGAIKVYHGSPYAFTKADSSKIGTGEGAQAYGHGLYWAENPKTAEIYATTLAKRADDPNYWQVGPGSRTKLPEALDVSAQKELDILSQKMRRDGNLKGKDYDRWRELFDRKDARDRVLDEVRPRPNLYEANLRWPDAAREAADPLSAKHFLDWDRPLSEQSEAIRKAIESHKNSRRLTGNDVVRGELREPTGEAIARRFGYGKDAAQEMSAAGIPGITYLDAGSRAAGQGTRNYVTFDDALVELLKRNGGLLGGGTREPTVSAMKRAIDLVGEKEFKKSVAYRLKELGPLSPEEQAAEIEGVARSLLEYLGAGK